MRRAPSRRGEWSLAIFLLIGSFVLQLAAQEAGGSLVSAGPPLYPLTAKAAGIEGTVKLKGIIGTDGKIRDLQVLNGRSELRQAAIEAVSHWTYRPYLKGGKLVEVLTTVTVNFKMGNKKEKAAAQAAAQAALARQAQSPE